MVNLTRELGLQYAQQGIQVNALCPGFYQTNLSRGAIDDPQVRATITAFIPMGRIAEAAEIKGPALFLASAASDYMTARPWSPMEAAWPNNWPSHPSGPDPGACPLVLAPWLAYGVLSLRRCVRPASGTLTRSRA